MLPSPAAANDPNDLTLGSSKTTGGYTIAGLALAQPTQPADHAFQLYFGGLNSGTDTRVQGRSVLSLSTSDQRMPNALRAVTSANGAAISASGVQYGIVASGTGGGAQTGVGARFVGANYGVQAQGGDVGASITGGNYGTLVLSGKVGRVLTEDEAVIGGTLDDTYDGDSFSGQHTLWYAPQRGQKWVKIAGPGTAGALHAVSPFRVYDSRAAQPSPGKIGDATSRLVDVSTARNIDTGAPTTLNAVPVGATAIAYNVTVVNTEQPGFLFVADGDATAVAASTINWTQPGTTLANASTVKLDASRQIRVFCKGGPTDFVIDVTGYYR